MTESKWVTMEEAALHLGLSTKTVSRRIADGSIRAMKFGPRAVRVDMHSLEVFGRNMAGGVL